MADNEKLITIDGHVDHGDLDDGNPIKIGGVGRDSVPSSVGAGARVDCRFDQRGQLMIVGNAQHDDVDFVGQNAPVKIGGVAAEFDADPPQISGDGDRVNLMASPQGHVWTLGGHPNIISREYMTTGAQTNDAIIDSVASGSHVVITEIEVLASAAGSTNPQVRIGFGTASVPTEPTTGNSAAGVVLSHPGIAAGSGVVRGNASGVIAVGGSGEELRITCDAPTDGQLTVLVSYYISTL